MLSPQKKAKLIWHCRRGMLELDLIFQRFLVQGLDELSSEQLVSFEQLLTAEDPDLYAWLMGYQVPDKELEEIVAFIQHYDNARKIS